VGAQVATNHVNTQIETGGGARRRQDAAVVHVEHVRVEIDGRMTTGKIGSGKPMRCGAQAVESPSTTPSNATTATRCGRLAFVERASERGVNPAIIVFLATGEFCHVS